MVAAWLAFWSLCRISRDSASFWARVAIDVSQLGFRLSQKLLNLKELVALTGIEPVFAGFSRFL
jgi:hypothetical protein